VFKKILIAPQKYTNIGLAVELHLAKNQTNKPEMKNQVLNLK